MPTEAAFRRGISPSEAASLAGVMISGGSASRTARRRRRSHRSTNMELDISRAPRRSPIRLSSRWTLVVLEPLPGVVAVGVFLDGGLLDVINEPAGKAFSLAPRRPPRSRPSHPPRLAPARRRGACRSAPRWRLLRVCNVARGAPRAAETGRREAPAAARTARQKTYARPPSSPIRPLLIAFLMQLFYVAYSCSIGRNSALEVRP